jgi:hypothetical protein
MRQFAGKNAPYRTEFESDETNPPTLKTDLCLPISRKSACKCPQKGPLERECHLRSVPQA